MNTTYNYLLLGLPIAFILIGFLRSQYDGKYPGGLISEKEMSTKWLADNTWSARFSILFLPLIFAFNLLVWIVFGLTSFFEFLAFILQKLWWLILFIWKLVFYPTIFWLAKLIWHYPVGYTWRFFEYSFKHISISLNQSNIIYSAGKLLKIGILGAVLSIIYLIFPNIISLTIGCVVFVLYFQFVVFQSISNFRPEFSENKNKPSLNMLIVWLGIAVLSSAILGGIKLLDTYPISAMGVTISQVLLPILVLVVIGFISAVTCLAPYYQNVDRINTLDYLKAILFRLPKLIYAQPFQLIGMAIVGAIPFLLVYALNYGTSIVTGRDFIDWKDEILTLDEHIPAYTAARMSIATNLENIDNLIKEKDSGVADYENSLKKLEDERAKAESLKNQIEYDKIHTFDGKAYVGETQFFSIPGISNCAEYKWVVEKNGNIIYEQTLYEGLNKSSSIFYYTWRSPGEYMVWLTPSNDCGSSRSIFAFVDVLEIPQKSGIMAPIGKREVCENEKLTYQTEPGYYTYEWRHPFGEEKTQNEKLTLTWGDVSGTVQVRGVNRDGSKTLWRGTDVLLKPLPFNDNSNERLLADEYQTEFDISREFIFKTIEEAADSLNRIAFLKERLTQLMDEFVSDIERRIKNAQDENEIIRNGIRDSLYDLIGKILAALGLALAFALLLPTIFTYFLLFHFDLFDFRQKGKHYWQNTLTEIRQRNPQQPLLGIFILLSIIGLIYLYFSMNII